MRRPVVGVMGSGVEGQEDLALPLGRWIAEAGYHLLTGGGGGVMASVTRGFVSVSPRAGVAVGVLPGGTPVADGRRTHLAPVGYPNASVEIAIRTHLPRSGAEGKDPMSRNHVNVLTSDVVVCLPGGSGTLTEIELALEYGRPIVLFDPEDRMAEAVRALAGLPRARSLPEVRAFVRAALFGNGDTDRGGPAGPAG
jgi:predicted Rossmann-fold nucleotide-binding protein